MGNNESSESRSNGHDGAKSGLHARHGVSRKKSNYNNSSAYSSPRSTPPPPSASSAASVPGSLLPHAQPSLAKSTETATATVSLSHSPKHGRTRSITSTTSRHNKDKAEDSASIRSDRSGMGQAESKSDRRPPSRSSTLPPAQNEQERPAASPLSRPVDIQRGGDGSNERDAFEPSNLPSESPYGFPHANRFDRPPRLPLPIEEELHTPGSPIIPPEDMNSPLEALDSEGTLPRRTSMLSSTTLDEDEAIGDETFLPDPHTFLPTVPTEITWRGSAEKVYVTGTFVNWERKFKLPRQPDGTFSATLPLKPGTHHLKFFVNDNMITSDDLPTTVDFTNTLVNYIEVSAPLPADDEQAPVPAEPVPIPGAAQTASNVSPRSAPMNINGPPRTAETGTDADVSSAAVGESQGQASEPLPTPQNEHPDAQSAPPKQKLPRPKYTNEIPAFLLDLDSNNQEDEKLQRAKRVEQHLPQPPSLPMFLGKSILNGQTPHKDDASVLLMPNHTVLNHLATSSIKSGVLATSGTTRYKRKVSCQSAMVRGASC